MRGNYHGAKLVSVKMTYTSYPPRYTPTVDRQQMRNHRTLAAAKKRCLQLGEGASIMKTRWATYADGSGIIHSPSPAMWELRLRSSLQFVVTQ